MQKICITIPCYNEANRLDVDEFIDFFSNMDGVYFCFVNDGSKDNTIDILKRIQAKSPDHVMVIDQEKNRGKAEAVREGILKSMEWKQFQFLGYWDADLSTPLSEIKNLLKVFENNAKLTFVLGLRLKRLGAQVERKVSRHILGRIFATFSNFILRLSIYDSQCGAKLFKTDIARMMFSEPFKTTWLFDVEIIARLRNSLGIPTIQDTLCEVPLQTWQDVPGSKLKIKHMFMVPLDLLKIHFNYNN